MERQINLKHVHVTQIDLAVENFDGEALNEYETELSFANGFRKDDDRVFGVIFEIAIIGKEENFKLKLKVTSHFETNLPIDDDFRNSSFVKVNAPAIAFPYIRTFISNLTLNSGYTPIILPSYNFVNMMAEKPKS